MGHNRLGKLAAHRSLPEIVQYLVTGGTPTADLVQQMTAFGRKALETGLRDPVFVEALWLLVRLPQAAASNAFASELADLGMDARAPESIEDLLVSYDKVLERVQRRPHSQASDLGEIARRAGLSALGEAVEQGMPLWSPSALDVQASLAKLRSPEKFGALAHHFHAAFVERVIHYFVDRNLHKLVGADRVARSVNDLASYDAAVRRHCREAALIMRAFAKDWLAKNQYRDGNAISKDDVRRFSGYAIRKIGLELEKRTGAKA